MKTNAYSDLMEHITFPENVINQVIIYQNQI